MHVCAGKKEKNKTIQKRVTYNATLQTISMVAVKKFWGTFVRLVAIMAHRTHANYSYNTIGERYFW